MVFQECLPFGGLWAALVRCCTARQAPICGWYVFVWVYILFIYYMGNCGCYIYIYMYAHAYICIYIFIEIEMGIYTSYRRIPLAVEKTLRRGEHSLTAHFALPGFGPKGGLRGLAACATGFAGC